MRSPEAVARRLSARRRWGASPQGRAYTSAWRKAHRLSERVRQARWKLARPDLALAQSRRYEAAHRAAPAIPIPSLHQGHEFFDQARAIVPARIEGAWVRFASELTDEDARSEATLALLEGRDPVVAVKRLRGAERAWGAMTVALPGWAS